MCVIRCRLPYPSSESWWPRGQENNTVSMLDGVSLSCFLGHRADPRLTVRRCKEVEERVVLHCLHDCALRSSAFVLLNLLDHFNCHILALLPVNCTPNRTPSTHYKCHCKQHNHYCRLTNYELLRWLVETPSRDFAHYRLSGGRPDML